MSTASSPLPFDYEKVTWGGGALIPPGQPDFLDHSLHLDYALEALRGVRGEVIEIGCGSGRFIASVAAARPDLEARGCDVSRSALEVGRAQHGARVQFDEGSATALPYEDGRFSGVLMVDVLEHLPDVHRALTEVRRVLAPGGVFHLVFPCEGNRLSLHGLWNALHGWKREHAGHIQRLRPAELLEAVSHAGLTHVEHRFSYHLLGQLYDAAVFGALHFGLDMHTARQEQVEAGAPSTLKSVRRLISRLLYTESRALAHVPSGMTLHVTATTPR